MTQPEPLKALLEQIQSFVKNVQQVKNLGPQQTQLPPAGLQEQWAAIRKDIESRVLPNYAAGGQLAIEAELDDIGSFVSLMITDVGTRTITGTLALNRIQGLQSRLQRPPPDPALAPGPAPPTKPNPETVKDLLEKAKEHGLEQERQLRRGAFAALLAGVVLVVAAALLPFVWGLPDGESGWAVAIGWSGRLLAMTALVVAGVCLFGVFRHLVDLAARAREERVRAALLASAPFFGEDRASAAAIIELVKNSSPAVAPTAEQGGLYLPPTLIELVLKHVPQLAQFFKGKS